MLFRKVLYLEKKSVFKKNKDSLAKLALFITLIIKNKRCELYGKLEYTDRNANELIKYLENEEDDSISYGIDNIMTVTLSSDERCVDNEIASRWLESFKSYLENPSTMMF